MDYSQATKGEILRALQSARGQIGFEGTDRGFPRHSLIRAGDNFQSAQENPAYDEDLERALLLSRQQVSGSPQERLYGVPGLPARLKYLPEMRESPRGGLFDAVMQALRGSDDGRGVDPAGTFTPPKTLNFDKRFTVK